jgi:hypothetical protein
VSFIGIPFVATSLLILQTYAPVTMKQNMPRTDRESPRAPHLRHFFGRGMHQGDLSSDPREASNLFYTDLTCGWMLAPSFNLIAEYEGSLRKYPNIEVGEDFKGYK